MAVTDRLAHRTVSRPPGRIAGAAIATGLGVLLAGAAGGGTAAAAPTASSMVTLAYTSVGEHAFVIPAGVSSIHVVAVGGKGGALPGYAPGGAGARVEGDLAVNPGQSLYAEVGGAGTVASLKEKESAAGGDNGGGSGGYRVRSVPGDAAFVAMSGGGGGGASDVRTSSVSGPSAWSLASRLLVAGGGGGGGSVRPGGDGGNPNGQTAVASGSRGGGGGTTSAGGAGGTYQLAISGRPGVFGRGGDGASGGYYGGGYGGGGGGGGYYGGGGGGGTSLVSSLAGGGGGGSSYGPAATGYTTSSAPASVTISYQPAAFAVRLRPASSTSMTVSVLWSSTSPGAEVRQWAVLNTPSEVWTFKPVGNDYQVINYKSGHCLTTPGTVGATLYQSPCTGSAGQLWNTPMTPGAKRPFQIKNPASGLYLEVSGGSTALGAAIVTGPWNSASTNQFFYATPA